jgi:hypothetical protein
MAEPHVTVAAGGFAGAGISSVTIILGAQADALAIGALAAIFVSIWMQTIDSRLKAAAAVLFSAMLAGYGSPVAAGYLVSSVPDIAGGDPLRLLLALVIGGATPSVFPLLLSRFGKTVSGECKP